MSTWTKLSAAEKTSAARAAKKTMTVVEAARHFKTTPGAIAGALYRDGRLARTAPSDPCVPPDTLASWSHIVAATFGVNAKPLLDLDEKRSLYRGVRHVLWYLLAQLEPPATLPGPYGSWRKRRDSDGMLGAVSRAFSCSDTAVEQAVRVVEDMRDDDPAFDARITELEQRLGLA